MQNEQVTALLALVVAFLTSFQVKTIGGLILLDLTFGITSAMKRQVFNPEQLSNFYRTNIVPSIIGYGALYVATKFILPPESGLIPDGLVTAAGGAIVVSLLASIKSNMVETWPTLGVILAKLRAIVPVGQTPADNLKG